MVVIPKWLLLFRSPHLNRLQSSLNIQHHLPLPFHRSGPFFLRVLEMMLQLFQFLFEGTAPVDRAAVDGVVAVEGCNFLAKYLSVCKLVGFDGFHIQFSG